MNRLATSEARLQAATRNVRRRLWDRPWPASSQPLVSADTTEGRMLAAAQAACGRPRSPRSTRPTPAATKRGPVRCGPWRGMIMSDRAAPPPASAESPAATEPAAGRALAAWWQVVDFKVGVVPAPVFLLVLALVAVFVSQGKVAADLVASIAVLAVGGFACAELGKRLPLARNIGAAAIFATFAPSWLVYAHLLPAPLTASIATFTRQSNVLYLFICAIVVGSILGMDRRVLVSGFLKIFAPLAAGSVLAGAVGCAVGSALGLGLRHTLFKIV